MTLWSKLVLLAPYHVLLPFALWLLIVLLAPIHFHGHGSPGICLVEVFRLPRQPLWLTCTMGPVLRCEKEGPLIVQALCGNEQTVLPAG